MTSLQYMQICRSQLLSLASILRRGRPNVTLLNRTSYSTFSSQSSSTPNFRKKQTDAQTDATSNNAKESSECEISTARVKHSQTNEEDDLMKTEKKDASFQASEYFRQSWSNRPGTAVYNGEKGIFKKYQTQKFPENITTSDVDILHSYHRENDSKLNLPDLRNPNERIEKEMPEDVDERRDPRLNIPLSRYGRLGKKSYYYTRKMSILGREGKVRDAIALFEHVMMVRDRVMPTKRTFVVLIGILGRAGYTDKAFEMFSKMKQFGLDPEDHIYTSLFNACANCPSPERGLQKASNLLSEMQDKGIKPNLYTVKASMKAMAMCGDYPRAFAIMDEASTRLQIDAECFDHLLMACISDKGKGFTRALQVWHKMCEFGIQPVTNTFNLLIRCARDCGIGEPGSFLTALGFNSITEISSDMGLLDKNNVKKTKLNNMMLLEVGGKSNSSGITKKQTFGKTQTRQNYESTSKLSGSSESEQEVVEVVIPDGKEHLEDASVIKSGLHEMDNVQAEEASNFAATIDRDLAAALSNKVPSHGEDGSRIYEWWEDEPVANSWTQTLVDFTARQRSASFESFQQSVETGNNEIVSQADSSKLISVSELKHPYGRLAILGGPKKLLSYMQDLGLHPEMRTYTQILACLPDNDQSEIEFVALMEEHGIKLDIDFLNDLMMRRNKRKKGEGVKAVLSLISKLRLTPNMRTYAALALACHKEQEAHSLLSDMKEANVEPNSVIMGHFICASGVNFTYKRHMLEAMEQLGLKPNKENIAVIETTIAYTKKKIIEAEKAIDHSSFYLSEPYQNSFRTFLTYYRKWLVRTELSQTRHPWDAFKPTVHKKEEKH